MKNKITYNGCFLNFRNVFLIVFLGMIFHSFIYSSPKESKIKLSYNTIVSSIVFQEMYEAEDGALFNGATIQDCESCSGIKQVGDLGGNNQSYFTYKIDVPKSGSYNLNLSFSSGDPRSIFISVNDESSVEVHCDSGDWGTVAEKEIQIELNAGTNSLKFYNDEGYGPNIDGFSLKLLDADCADCTTYLYGSHGKIVYDIRNGTFSVFQDSQLIIKDAYSEASNFNNIFSSKDYNLRTISQTDFSDNIGAGKKIIITLSDDNLPEMKQIFYTYSDEAFFLIEVSLEDSNMLESNYMVPLISSEVTLNVRGDHRVLDVPFDNDAWVRYESISTSNRIGNISSEVTSFFDNDSRNGLVVGSVEHTVWKTGIKNSGLENTLDEFKIWSGYTSSSETRDEVEHGKISGNIIKSPKIFIGYFQDWRIGMEKYGVANKNIDGRYINDWQGKTPFGWNSWGSIQSDITLDKAKAVVDFFADEIPIFRNDDTAYIDLDSYWDNLVVGGLEGDFSKLTEFVQYCKSHNLKAGIYWAPFVDWGKYDRKVEGSNYNYEATWTNIDGDYYDLDGARAMDPTHPGTKERIDLVVDKFKESGFEMIKIDFIGHAAAEASSFYDSNVTTGMQAFKSGMEYLLDRLGNDMLVYAAISPNLATGRYVHARRIACDAYSDINATEYTLNSTSYGWWQSEIYDYIDADHVVFGNSSKGENRARLTSAIVNGSIIVGDDYSVSGQWIDKTKEFLQNERILDLAREGSAFVPVEGNTNKTASELFIYQFNGKYYLAVFNYGEKKSLSIDLNRLGIATDGYCVNELFSGDRFSLNGSTLNITIATKDAAIYEFNSGVNSCMFSLPDNYKVLSTDVSCNGEDDGQIAIEFKNTEYKYNVEITGQESVSLPIGTNHYELERLPAGIYNICFTVEGVGAYKQCFQVTIKQPETISVISKHDEAAGIVHLELDGAERFYVCINGSELLYNSGSYELNMPGGLNKLSVKGDLECQGVYTENIFIPNSVRSYPNPTTGIIQILIPSINQNVIIEIFDLQGRLIKNYNSFIKESQIEIDLSDQNDGSYVIRISGNEFNEIIKVLKK